MGKGIKMRSAKDQCGSPYSVELLQKMDDDGLAVPDLVCDDVVCGCAVRFVPRYKQNRTNRVEPIEVPPYIGLTRHSEHVSGCHYNAKGRLEVIAAHSDRDFLAALDDGKRELRLLALHNSLRCTGHSGQGSSPDESNPRVRPGSTATDVKTSDKKLDSYLRTTADLLALRAACESDSVLAAELTLRMGSKRIPWKNFFFERERLAEAWEMVRKAGTEVHPIAIVGEVRNHYCPTAGAKQKSSFLNCRSWYEDTTDPNRLESYEVSVGHADGSWLACFPVGMEIVMFGLWKAADVTKNTAPDKQNPERIVTFDTRKLVLWPQFKKQVVEIA